MPEYLSSKLKLVGIKDIALICMIIDHANKILYIYNPTLYVIGRISMPIYAFCIAKGFLYTRDKYMYFARLLILACISEPIYDYAFYETTLELSNQNVIFGYSIALLLLIIYKDYKLKLIPKVIIFLTALLLADAFKIDYGWTSIVSVTLFYTGYKSLNKSNQLLIYLAAALAPLMKSMNILQLPCFSAIAPIYYLEKRPNLISRKMFYIAYPLHLILLTLLALLF